MIGRPLMAAALVLALVVAVTGDASSAGAPAVAGQVYAFGNDDAGELGSAALTAPTSSSAPVLVDLPAASGRATAISPGYDHSLVVTSTGQLYAFGSNTEGQLGTTTGSGTLTPASTPAPVNLPGATGPATAAAAGQFFSLAVTSVGQLYAFGLNSSGQLGSTTNNGNQNPNPTPAAVAVPGATGPFVQVSAGAVHGLALTSTGQVFAFGDNRSGQLGFGTNLATDNPNPPHLIVLPGTPGPIVQIAAGGWHTLVLTAAGQVYAFGLNLSGELGNTTNNGLPASNPAPALVSLPGATGPVVQIAAGAFHSLALTSTGQLYAFGDNFYGQLGNATNVGMSTANPTPALVSLPAGSGRILRIGAGDNHSLAVTAKGQIYAFGHNNAGQLGSVTGSSNPTPTLVEVPPGTAIDSVAAGSEAAHSLAIVSALAVLNGALTPGQVGVPYDATAVAGGGTAPYTWSASGLAPGLALDSASGKISGTPTVTGTYGVVLTLTDARGIAVASPALTLAITAVPSAATTTTTRQTTVTTTALKADLLTQLAPKGKAAAIAALVKARRYAMSFRALRAGTLVIDWYYLPKGASLTSKRPKAVLVAAGKRTFAAAGTATVTLRLTAKGTRLLGSAKRLKLTARSVFTPRGARAVSTSKSFTLVR